MSLTLSNSSWVSLTVSLVLWSFCMSLTDSCGFLAISHYLSNPMELLNVSHCLWLLLAVSLYLSGPMELLHVSHSFLWLLTVSHCLSGLTESLHVFHSLL